MRGYVRWLMVATIFVAWFGCQKEPPLEGLQSEPKIKFSKEEAKAVYDYLASMRTRSTVERCILDPGEIHPYWPEAEYSENEAIAGYDVEITVDHYYEHMQLQPDSSFLPREMFPRLVSLATIDQSREPVALIAYYLSDLPPMSIEEEDPGEGLLNCQPKVGFTGRILYTSLKGHPVAISQHIRGEQVNEAFLWNATDSVSLRNLVGRFNNIAKGIYIRSEEQAYGNGTRSESSIWDLDGGYIGDVVVVSKPFMPNIAPEKSNPFDKDKEVTDPTWVAYKKRNEGGGSSGESEDGDSTDTSASKHNPKLKSDDELVHKFLDSLMQDCMGQKLIRSIDMEITIIIGGDGDHAHLEPGSGTINFIDGRDGGKQRPYVLLEELIHVYQYQRLGGEKFNQGKLNREIEAKVGWLMYEMRTRGGYNGNAYNKQLGGKGSTVHFADVITHCYPHYDNGSDTHAYFYDLAVASIRNIPVYSNVEKYPEVDSLRNFDCIEELSKDCEQ